MTDGRTDGGDCNIPDAFLKKRGDKYWFLSCISEINKANSTNLYPPTKGY